jgi:hypothetical protein
LICSDGAYADFYGTQFAASQDGVNWQIQDNILSGYFQSGTLNLNIAMIYPNIRVTGAVYGNGVYVVAGTCYTNTSAGNYPVVITSRDATKWTMTRLDASCNLERIAYGNGGFVATGSSGGILTSPDGLTWTARDTGANTSYVTISFCNDKFVALGDDGAISTSPDGVNWTNSRSSYQAVFTVGKANYVLNGQTYPTDASPFIEDGRVFVPVRYLAGALGLDIGLTGGPPDQTVVLLRNTSHTVVSDITLEFGKRTLTCNSSGTGATTRTMDVAPLIRDGRGYIPARYVAEVFGYTVFWDPTNQTVTIK